MSTPSRCNFCNRPYSCSGPYAQGAHVCIPNRFQAQPVSATPYILSHLAVRQAYTQTILLVPATAIVTSTVATPAYLVPGPPPPPFLLQPVCQMITPFTTVPVLILPAIQPTMLWGTGTQVCFPGSTLTIIRYADHAAVNNEHIHGESGRTSGGASFACPRSQSK